jgi:hypothetical protein
VTRRASATVAGALALVLLLTAGCSGRADFDEHVTFADVEGVVHDAGLSVCSVSHHPDGLANQAEASRTYRIGQECPSDDVVQLVVDRFADEADRDGAARQFEVLTRPRGDGVVWTWGPMTIFATAEHDDAVMDRLTAAFDEAGAS